MNFLSYRSFSSCGIRILSHINLSITFTAPLLEKFKAFATELIVTTGLENKNCRSFIPLSDSRFHN